KLLFLFTSLILIATGTLALPRMIDNILHDPDDRPTRDDIINAVRHVANKPVLLHNCTSFDVNTMPARCPFVGATYPDFSRACPQLPGPNSSWDVQQQGEDAWRVSRAGSVWDVTKLDGQATNVDNVARVSKFSFHITPRQRC